MRFRSQGGEREAFLQSHDDLRDLLEPMLADADPARAEATPGDVVDTVLGGDFRLEREIGRGGSGVVYAARQISLGRRVAVKVLPRHPLLTPSAITRFRREAKTIATLSHPGIVRVLAVSHGTDRDAHWFAMELVEGSSLASHIGALQQQGQAPAPWTRRMVQLAVHVADALHYVHELGIVHRDVKPSNVLLRHDSTPVLTDFGLAHDDNAPTITSPGGRAGTPCYMAPEQIADATETVDARCDVFALGATLYEMLTFERAFDAGSADKSMQRVLNDEPADPRRRNAAISRDLNAILTTAMAKDRRRRYQTVAALADDLRAYLAYQPTVARPVGPLARLLRWARRRKALATALFGLFATLVAGLVVSLWLWHAAATEEHRATTLLGEWQRLADRRQLDELVAEADTDLWPAVPAKVPAMDAWLVRAQALAARQPAHEEALRRSRVGGDLGEQTEVSAWRRQQLEGLVRGLSALVADSVVATTIASVQWRRRWAQELPRLTLEAPSAAWRAAVDRVSRNVRYGGLALTPQLGLIPLGADPRSGFEEFADPLTGQVPERGADGELVCRQRTALVFVLLPGGEFVMGAQKDDPRGRNYDPAATYIETPPHIVWLDPFLLGKHELTQAQWRAVVGDTAGWWQPGRVVRGVTMEWRHPVANVSWEQCDVMSFRCGFLLPTEAQWEYACRAGSDTPWWTGRDADSLFGAANLADEASRDEYPVEWLFHRGLDDGHAVPAPVGTYRQNGFGLFDMHGNVREWCRDRMLRYDNAVAPSTGERLWPVEQELRYGEALGSRVHRGGSCASVASEHRCAHREAQQVATMLPTLGVRPARLLAR